MIGKTIAHYEILDKLGEGGMGVVYRARDTRLGRDVAIKVLPEQLAQDRERMARFEREAHVLAQLNHPNISSIFGLEKTDGQYALVMELVDGSTLADRLDAGPIPAEDALPMARQIAEALSAAHEKGIIHRDLKPANIKVDREGNVKVLDFGLAKALEGESATTQPDDSPTLTIAATQAGVILGTAAYMSPEQARGRPVDKRADIWAFGVVLYEMLTGRQLFGGETVSDSLAGVLKTEIDLAALPEGTPAAVRRLLRRCLERDRRRRLKDIGDAVLEIEEGLGQGEEAPRAVERAGGGWRYWALAAVALVAVAGLAAVWFFGKNGYTGGPMRTFTVAEGNVSLPAISRDGQYVAYVSTTPNRGSLLMLHDLKKGEDRQLSGPHQKISGVFWADRGEFVAYHVPGEIRTVSAVNGHERLLAELPTKFRIFGGTSTADGSMVVVSVYDRRFRTVRLWKTTLTGGSDQPALAFEPEAEDEELHFLYPQLASNREGEQLLTYVKGSDAGGYLAVTRNLSTGERRVHGEAMSAIYANEDHILVASEAGILGTPVSGDSLEAAGEPVPVHGDLASWEMSVAEDGTLTYLTGDRASGQQLVWKSRSGDQLGVIGKPQERISDPQLSPDENSVVVRGVEAGNADIWIHEVDRGIKNRLTTHPETDVRPLWSPDGEFVLVHSWRDNVLHHLLHRADGSGEAREFLPAQDSRVWLMAWSRDGRFLAGNALLGPPDLSLVWCEAPADGKATEVKVLLDTPFSEDSASFSPGAESFVYASDESGTVEIYARRFPEGDGKVRVSTDGGKQPLWSRDGKEVYYLQGETIMAVPVTMAPELSFGEPEPLFYQPGSGSASVRPYDVSADGQRFVVIEAVEGEGSRSVRLVENWWTTSKDSEAK